MARQQDHTTDGQTQSANWKIYWDGAFKSGTEVPEGAISLEEKGFYYNKSALNQIVVARTGQELQKPPFSYTSPAASEEMAYRERAAYLNEYQAANVVAPYLQNLTDTTPKAALDHAIYASAKKLMVHAHVTAQEDGALTPQVVATVVTAFNTSPKLKAEVDALADRCPQSKIHAATAHPDASSPSSFAAAAAKLARAATCASDTGQTSRAGVPAASGSHVAASGAPKPSPYKAALLRNTGQQKPFP